MRFVSILCCDKSENIVQEFRFDGQQMALWKNAFSVDVLLFVRVVLALFFCIFFVVVDVAVHEHAYWTKSRFSAVSNSNVNFLQKSINQR